jgi:hypothetical protein
MVNWGTLSPVLMKPLMDLVSDSCCIVISLTTANVEEFVNDAISGDL